LLETGVRAVVEVTGLHNPCVQIDGFQSDLMRLLRFRDSGGAIRRIGGVMDVVVVGGIVEPGDETAIDRPPEPHIPLAYVANSHEPAIPLRSHHR
jgi:MOSC domain-containing protein YiiM